MSSIGNNIRTYRKLAGLTQGELAKKLSMTKSTVSNYERGIRTPDIGIIRKMSDILNVEVSVMMYGVNGDTEEVLADKTVTYQSPADAVQENEVVHTLRKMTKDYRDIYLGIGKQILLVQDDPGLYLNCQVLPVRKKNN